MFKRRGDVDDGWADICLNDGWYSININDEGIPTYRVRILRSREPMFVPNELPSYPGEAWICEMGRGGLYQEGWMMGFPSNWEVLSGQSGS